MRIDSATTAIYGAQPVMKTAKSEATRETRSTSAAQSPFSVQLTNMLSGVQPSGGEVRTEKVQNISQQLASGNYNISGQDVASKMLMALTP